MAFKVTSLRRDYLARDILFQLLSQTSVTDRIYNICGRVPYEGTSFFGGNLVKLSVDLADDFLKQLNISSPSSASLDEDTNNSIGSSSPIVLDAELDE